MANKNPFGNIPTYGPGNRNTGMGKSMGVDKSGRKASSSKGPSKAVMSEKTLDMRTAKAPSFKLFSDRQQAQSKTKISDADMADRYEKVYKVDPAKKGYSKAPKLPGKGTGYGGKAGQAGSGTGAGGKAGKPGSGTGGKHVDSSKKDPKGKLNPYKG